MLSAHAPKGEADMAENLLRENAGASDSAKYGHLQLDDK